MSSISLTNVIKTFGELRAIDNVSIEVASGESLVVLGPSGSGKSTLLRVIAGLELQDSGDITIGGVPQTHLPPHKRDVAIVFQNFALYPHLSAFDNIALGLRHGLKLSRAEAQSRADDVAQRLEITELLGRRPRAMSGGQRQRVALARALARRSGVVLLDEPLSGLDAQLRLTLRSEIASLLRSTGATTLHVTHDQNDAMAMADRIAVVRGGVIEQLGTPEDLYARPNSLFVAGFIGSPAMNLLDGSSGAFGPVRSGMTLGIRPEHVKLGGHGDWTFDGVVKTVEHEGPSKIVHLDVSGQPVIARVQPQEDVQPDTVVPLSCTSADVHVFDSESGLALGTADTVWDRAVVSQ
ncbi:ABC transporter ATP-binding protein [Rhodococcus sp. SBT000017]|uniref:ABC transporter ATP-binding protein n=1 Tax=Rhodococcus sp. SBT000017 TaxID=1803385 RepID=UPI000EF8660D|nr:ABC transporter ATP-binding protein [Rhodococcus sp. SBT000017]RMB71842.1 ABC transporter ATP-binding protein [Rhodococcus sp. SBT000017]